MERNIEKSEEFEGTTGQGLYNQMLDEMYDYITKQMEFVWRLFSFFLPNATCDEDNEIPKPERRAR